MRISLTLEEILSIFLSKIFKYINDKFRTEWKEKTASGTENSMRSLITEQFFHTFVEKFPWENQNIIQRQVRMNNPEESDTNSLTTSQQSFEFQLSMRSFQNKEDDQMQITDMQLSHPEMKKCNIVRILTRGCQKAQIVREVRDVLFPKIQVIVIDGNNITSVEGMNRIWMPCLVWMNISDNHISTIKDWKKTCWPLIKVINMDGNHIIEPHALAFMEGDKLHRLDFDFYLSCEQCSDLRSLTKLKSPLLQTLYIKSEERLSQTYISEVLKKKFHYISLRLKF